MYYFNYLNCIGVPSVVFRQGALEGNLVLLGICRTLRMHFGSGPWKRSVLQFAHECKDATRERLCKLDTTTAKTRAEKKERED